MMPTLGLNDKAYVTEKILDQIILKKKKTRLVVSIKNQCKVHTWFG